MKIENFVSQLPEWKEELRRQMRLVELDEVWDRELQAKIVRRRTTKDRAATHWAQSRARRAEATALLAAASEEYKRYLKKQAKIRMARDIEQKDALDHGIVIETKGPPDIVRDIQWVYDNLGRLFASTEKGTKVFNLDVLEQAPSDGAVGLAGYALKDQKAFFDKFATKLIPRDSGNMEVAVEQTEEERLAELDPSFDDMKEFFNMEVAE